jgi:hypothetical protein
LTRDLVLHLDGRIRFRTADENHDVDPVLLDDHADALAGLQRESIVMLTIGFQLTRDRLLRQKHRRVRLGRFHDLSTGRGDRRYRNARAADEAGEIPPRAADPVGTPAVSVLGGFGRGLFHTAETGLSLERLPQW